MEAEARHDQLHVSLTQALFAEQPGVGAEAQLQSSVDSEQSARNAVDAAREELDRTWDEAGRAVSATGEPYGDGSAEAAPSGRA
jgi:hypothetical protein